MSNIANGIRSYAKTSGWTLLFVLLLAGCSTFSEEQPTLLVDGKGAGVAAQGSPAVSGTLNLSIGYYPQISEVAYYLNDPQVQGEPWKVTTEQPFKVTLDTTELEDGEHTLTALVSVGRGVTELEASFIVDNSGDDDAGTNPPPSDPNPAPPSDTPDETQSDMATQMLTLVNQARSTGYDCDTKGYFGPTAPLRLNSDLNNAAKVQADHLANRSRFGHVGPGGSDVSDRASAAGYDGSGVGENVAAGQNSTREVVQGWLESDGHCSNIMNPNFKEMGTAVTDGASYGVDPDDGSITWYEGLQWVQVFASPR